MNRAVILHGTDGSPDENWFPWLKSELEKIGYEVWVPHLPNNHTPNRHKYNDFLLSESWDFTNSLVIGHSSGAVSILNMLEDDRFPKIDTAILVGAWARMESTDLDREQFKDLFPEPNFDFNKIKSKAKKFIFVHSDDDPYCPIDQARYLSKELSGQFNEFKGMQHFGRKQNPRFNKFPELLEIIQKDKS